MISNPTASAAKVLPTNTALSAGQSDLQCVPIFCHRPARNTQFDTFESFNACPIRVVLGARHIDSPKHFARYAKKSAADLFSLQQRLTMNGRGIPPDSLIHILHNRVCL
ncbi:hypothetical protein SAMN05421747_10970 [Parapedobacter composti]|uniref:Uncharacterized protein n=1 Tax=Parapedobacter composti TaxID=623281 RepID=A0A1I1IHB0_9SPHI|nr:hypothetical protein SAMN05421747_10970 [Parapedobacter composti]